MDAIAAAYGSSDEEEKGREKGYRYQLVPVGEDHLEEFLHKHESLKNVTHAKKVREIKHDLCSLNQEAALTYSSCFR